MSRWLILAIIAFVLVVGFFAAQLVQPDFRNPSVDGSRAIHAPDRLVVVLDRACGDCHSNETRWPAYARVAPLSWLMAYGVKQGRAALNFSEWAGYTPDMQRALLEASCRDASSGKMPGSIYVSLHPEARLSKEDVDTICAAAGEKP